MTEPDEDNLHHFYNLLINNIKKKKNEYPFSEIV